MPIPRRAMEQNGDDSAELCIGRLTRKLSEVEAVVTASEGKANHMRKERDVAKMENEKLRKEVARLKNELLKVQMNSALKEKEVTHALDVKDGSKGTGNSMAVFETEIPVLRKDDTIRELRQPLPWRGDRLKKEKNEFKFEGVTSQFRILRFSCSSFVIRVYFLHP